VKWILGSAAVGFGSSFLFSDVLGLARTPFVAAHAVVVLSWFGLYLLSERIRFSSQLRRRWLAGLLVGLVFGLILARNVLSQPASARPEGGELAFNLVWSGLVYGLVDALLLTVVPVLACYGSRPDDQLRRAGPRWRFGLLALGASLAITGAYHLGFEEFRGVALIQPLIGNGLITLSYLLAGNPLAPIGAHLLMHLAAVWHGMATTAQLPPHY
jgi:hypothetical protein